MTTMVDHNVCMLILWLFLVNCHFNDISVHADITVLKATCLEVLSLQQTPGVDSWPVYSINMTCLVHGYISM